ncbi:MAG: DNA recombination/repair protein RecA [Nitrososphaera sp.]|nr:DNA recombination/repair protein RecA [Nitrososphaera sp.]
MVKRERLEEGSGGNYFAAPKQNLQFIPSGCVLLDLILGGGWCEGRIANVVGDKSAGKTLLMIEACANFARKYPKGKIYYREAESAFDRDYAAALGMPVDRVNFLETLETVEDFFEDLEQKCTGTTNKFYVLDSLDALSDRSEMARDIDASSYGANKAKQMSEVFRRSVRKIAESNSTVNIVSQIRDKINVSFGRKTTRSGGRALDFYSSQTVYLTNIGRITKTIKGIKRPVALKVKAQMDKNKVGLPFRECEFDIRFGFGVDDLKACLEWMKVSGGLKDLGIKDVESGIKDVESLDDMKYRSELERIHDAVRKRWYEIETSLLPKRRKY